MKSRKAWVITYERPEDPDGPEVQAISRIIGVVAPTKKMTNKAVGDLVQQKAIELFDPLKTGVYATWKPHWSPSPHARSDALFATLPQGRAVFWLLPVEVFGL